MVKPISASGQAVQNKESFKDNPKKDQDPPPQTAQVLLFKRFEPAATAETSLSIEARPNAKGNLSVAHAVIQLLLKLSPARNAMLKRLGARAYQSLRTSGGKFKKFPKGSMLDHKAE